MRISYYFHTPKDISTLVCYKMCLKILRENFSFCHSWVFIQTLNTNQSFLKFKEQNSGCFMGLRSKIKQ